jgi:uncharacterized protein YbjT (DUF2867 family)
MKVIVTGATGMVGEGVLHMCLRDPGIEQVLIVNRKSYGLSHPKLKEIIHKDFFDISPIEKELTGYDACFFCLGVSSVGMKESEYYRLTYALTLGVAKTLSRLNPQMTFVYVSGAGTDSTEKGKSMWARVKGKTENDLMKLPFKKVFAFRPGFMKPIRGLKNTLSAYKYLGWLYPLGRAVAPGIFCSLEEVGVAMIEVARYGNPERIIEGKDIIRLAAKNR